MADRVRLDVVSEGVRKHFPLFGQGHQMLDVRFLHLRGLHKESLMRFQSRLGIRDFNAIAVVTTAANGN